MSPPKNGTDFENHESGITKDFLENILRRPINSFEVKIGSKCGDNFMSVIYSIKIIINKDSTPIHLVCKTFPSLPSRQKFLSETNLFEKELLIYTEYIPQLIKFQDEFSPHGTQPIRLAVPPFIAGQTSNSSKNEDDQDGPLNPLENYIIMTDIRTWGYKMADKTLGLDFAHCALAVKELAKIHALGWAYKKMNNLDRLSSKFPYLVETCFHRSRTDIADLMETHFEIMGTILKTHFGAQSKIGDFIEKVGQIGPTEIFCDFIPDDGVIDEKKVCNYFDKDNGYIPCESWVVSLHGDSWMNNMLFRYDDDTSPNTPTKLMMLDLQLFREACPTTDLAYMFYTSTTYEMRQAHLETLLHIYYQQFLHLCTQLHVEPLPNFTFENFLVRFKRAKLFGFIAACLVLPVILSADGTDLDKVKVEVKNEEGKAENELANVFKSLSDNALKNKVLKSRIVGIANELLDENFF